MSDEENELLEIGDELLAEARKAGTPMPDDMHPLARKTVHTIDLFAEWQGRIVCLAVVPIIAAMVYEVLARK